MTYEETMDRCSIIRDTLTSGHSITIKPTLENIEWVTMCAEAAEKVDIEKKKQKKFVERAKEWSGEE
jgi:hypothetical protein